MAEPTLVELDWVGPFCPVGDNGDLEPPEKPGVYVWVMGEQGRGVVTYVGKASNLAARIYEHTFWMLGGAYYLHDPAELSRGRLKVKHKPDEDKWGREFYKTPEKSLSLALENARAYRFYWAPVRSDLIEAVESCLITALRESQSDSADHLQVSRLSVADQRSPYICVKRPFPSRDMRTPITAPQYYGTKHVGGASHDL